MASALEHFRQAEWWLEASKNPKLSYADSASCAFIANTELDAARVAIDLSKDYGAASHNLTSVK